MYWHISAKTSLVSAGTLQSNQNKGRFHLQTQILKHRGFRNLWLGQAVSQIGDSLYYASFMFMVRKFTGSDAMVGYMGAAEVLPFALLSGYAGVMVDRLDRRKVLLYSDLFCGLMLLLLSLSAVLLGHKSVPLLFVTAASLACARVFFFPAKNASIPHLVPEDQVSTAFTFSLGTQNLMMMAGTALSAGVIAKLWQYNQDVFFHGIVLMNAASFLLSAVFIAKLPKILPEKSEDHVQQSAMREFKQGVKFILNRKDLKTLMLVSVLCSLGISPFFVAFVAANEAWFGGNPNTLSWSEFSFFGGMMLGTFLLGKYPTKRPGMAFTIALAIVGVGVACMAFSPMVSIAGLQKMWAGFFFFALMNVVCGVAMPYADVPIRSYLQLTVPDSFRGRVNSLHHMLWTIMMPVGMIGLGSTIEKVGIANAFLVMGALMTLTFIIGFLGREFWLAKMPETSSDDLSDEEKADQVTQMEEIVVR